MRICDEIAKLFDGTIDYLLITRPESITYLTGFYSAARRPSQLGLTCALIDKQNIHFYCPESWKKEAESQLMGTNTNIYGYAGDKQNLTEMIARDAVFASKISKIGIEPEYMDYELYTKLIRYHSFDFISVKETMDHAKAIKTDDEVIALKKSAKLAKDAMEYARTIVRSGAKEYELAAEIEYYMRRRGSDGTPFTMKALSGENSVVTINIPGAKEVKEGDCVLFDFGAIVDHYISDWTRTFCCGKASEEQKELYRLVWKIERACIEMIKPGILVSDLMDRAMQIAEQHPMGRWFNPYLGHSIGLGTSEWPILKPGVEIPLEQGMVLTIEPGIYIPGIGGVRIEDELFVTGAGHEIWTGLEHEVFEVFN